MSKILKGLDEAYGRYGRRDAYQRDYDASVAGMGKRDSYAYQMDGGANDEGWDEPQRDYYKKPAAGPAKKGYYFYNVPAGQEDKANEVGLFRTKTGKWYSPFQNTRADMFFGAGKFWSPKNESVTEADKEAEYGSEWDEKVKRIGQLAKQGERKTVWDPEKRVYKTVPVNQSKEQDVTEGPAFDKWADERVASQLHKLIAPEIKGKIQNIVSRLSDEYGMWDHEAQTFTPEGLEHLKSILKFNETYIKYALSLTSRDFEAEGVIEGDKKPHPKTWHDVDPKLGKQVDKMTQAEKVKKGLAHPDTLKKKGVEEANYSPMTKDSMKADKIKSLKNLIAIAKEQGRGVRAQELELELKKLQGVEEGLADDLAAFAAKHGGKVRHGPQPNKPMTAPTSAPQVQLSTQEREALAARLKELEARFDPNYQYSDDYSFHSEQRRIAAEIAGIKKKLGESIKGRSAIRQAMEAIDAGQRRAKQVPAEEMPKKTSPVLGQKEKQHPFKGRAVGGGL